MTKEIRREYYVYEGPYQRDDLSLPEGWFVVCERYFEDGTSDRTRTDIFPHTPEGQQQASEVAKQLGDAWRRHYNKGE